MINPDPSYPDMGEPLASTRAERALLDAAEALAKEFRERMKLDPSSPLYVEVPPVTGINLERVRATLARQGIKLTNPTVADPEERIL